jgi:hypothetical protein
MLRHFGRVHYSRHLAIDRHEIEKGVRGLETRVAQSHLTQPRTNRLRIGAAPNRGRRLLNCGAAANNRRTATVR